METPRFNISKSIYQIIPLPVLVLVLENYYDFFYRMNTVLEACAVIHFSCLILCHLDYRAVCSLSCRIILDRVITSTPSHLHLTE